ncbi:hypothetical protein ANN_00161 [Periplaneta americana]|uniref:Uncharacterized protein n=1 Tax=Periplaneta americana TaxID=6978 RepID=A0ABQ8TTZ9_PERAM|nr:hypothetical protein ANN_00161 [Periplaneta americana]
MLRKILTFTISGAPRIKMRKEEEYVALNSCILEHRSSVSCGRHDGQQLLAVNTVWTSEATVTVDDENRAIICWRTVIVLQCKSDRESMCISASENYLKSAHNVSEDIARKSLIWDSTCVDILAPSHVPNTSRRAASAAELAVKKKVNKYAHLLDNYIFVPFAVETFGPWSHDAKVLVSQIGQILISITGDRRCTTYLRQRLSIAIQRGNAMSVLGTLPESSPLDELFLLVMSAINMKQSAQGSRKGLRETSCCLKTPSVSSMDNRFEETTLTNGIIVDSEELVTLVNPSKQGTNNNNKFHAENYQKIEYRFPKKLAVNIQFKDIFYRRRIWTLQQPIPGQLIGPPRDQSIDVGIGDSSELLPHGRNVQASRHVGRTFGVLFPGEPPQEAAVTPATGHTQHNTRH